MSGDSPMAWQRDAEEYSELARLAIGLGLGNVARWASVGAAHNGRLYLLWKQYRDEDERDAVEHAEYLERMGRFAFDAKDIPCPKCRDKYTAEGRERGDTW